MANQTRTVASVKAAAQHAIQNALFNAVEHESHRVMSVLLSSPELANGLKDFDEIARQLAVKGHREELTRLSASDKLWATTRKVLVSALMSA